MTTQPSAVPIALTDRVSDVLKRDEALVDVFVQHAPHFSKLRNKAMRRVMARLITVEQAARTAGIPANVLLRDLNAALGIIVPDAGSEPGRSPTESAAKSGASGASSEGRDTTPTRPREAPVVEVDVREDLRSGNEPFSKIMAAVAALNTGDVLHLRATFEPVPLFSVLGKRGFVHESRENAGDDWSVWFWRPESGSTGDAAASANATTEPATQAEPPAATQSAPGATADDDAAAVTSEGGDERTIWLDVREFGPPEPMLRTLAALETLPDGYQLIQINARVPQFLIPMLAERGYACEVDESHADRVLVRIWRAT